MAIPDFEAYANVGPSPLTTAVQTGLQTYQTVSQMREQRAAEERRQQQMQMLQQQFALNQQVKAHQLATSRLNNVELGHTYLAHSLADLHDASVSDKPQVYQHILSEAQNLGIPINNLPSKYNATVKNLAATAYAATPSAIADRKQALETQRAEMQNRARIRAAQIRAGGGAGADAAIPAVGGQIITPVGQRATLTGVDTGVPSGIGAQASQPSAQAGITIRPTRALEAAYEKAAGTSFNKEIQDATGNARQARGVISDIEGFVREAPQIPTGTGPGMGYLAGLWGTGQLAKKYQNKLALGVLALQKFGRVTNKEMGIVQNSTLNVMMDPKAYKILAPQLRATAERNIEYSKFLSAAAQVGIRNVATAQKIWNKFQDENQPIKEDGQVDPSKIGGWERYLTPEALQTELRPISSTGETERTLTGPDGKKYTISYVRKIAAQARKQ